jgi:anti-sigma regulatory factor (Ser/Thr protein kinase)
MHCMNIEFPYKVKLQFPGDTEYIPSIRKFVSEILQVSNFSSKFAYRSEIIVDEISNNAVIFGCCEENANIELECIVYEDRIEFTIKDQGGTKANIVKLQNAIKNDIDNDVSKKGLGIEIVKMLSESMDIQINEDNLTSIHIIRRREDL